MTQPSKIDDHRDDDPFVAFVVRAGGDPDEIIELDLTSETQRIPGAPPRGKPRTAIDRSSVGYGRSTR